MFSLVCLFTFGTRITKKSTPDISLPCSYAGHFFRHHNAHSSFRRRCICPWGKSGTKWSPSYEIIYAFRKNQNVRVPAGPACLLSPFFPFIFNFVGQMFRSPVARFCAFRFRAAHTGRERCTTCGLCAPFFHRQHPVDDGEEKPTYC